MTPNMGLKCASPSSISAPSSPAISARRSSRVTPIITDGDRIVTVGTAAARDVEACDVVIDADRTTAVPD